MYNLQYYSRGTLATSARYDSLNDRDRQNLAYPWFEATIVTKTPSQM
jgi:hypothetical protein